MTRTSSPVEATLFDVSPSQNVGRPKLSVLPVSVMEIESEPHHQRRSDGGHDDVSSRQEMSHFPTVVGDLCFQLYLKDATFIYDPFGGWGERGSLARTYGKVYQGADTSIEAIRFAASRYDVHNVFTDSRTCAPPCFDGLLTCPPYWNLERYHGNGLDAAPTWVEFLSGLETCFAACYDSAQVGAVFCVLTGDWRAEGTYYDLTFQTQAIFAALGATVIDSVVVSRKNISKIKIMIPQAVRLGYTVKVHEMLTVFQKR